MNERESLSGLWQQQEVKLPDTEELKKLWNKERNKQKAYLSLDLVGITVAPLLLLFLYEQLHWFEVLWLVVVGVIAILFTGYLIWLRRGAVMQRYASTGSYLELMKQQYMRNILLAKCTQWLVYGMATMFILMFCGLSYFEVLGASILYSRIVISSLILAAVLIPVWIWARRRADVFATRLVHLQQLR
ncbi:hypothetical protein KIH87_06245 [Paraneptunicella aestuarii]|uniref:hypothetical protein n=1 Tax=Paraneptunicella aestuarii TaxID=2831148 RepID=UPI001E333305|nr:hypothetical protein [Paraneptunicella aestuarii]UAA39950.1 hypothetical protein KIH87_06245 [Paraneptunicella aestuarii]